MTGRSKAVACLEVLGAFKVNFFPPSAFLVLKSWFCTSSQRKLDTSANHSHVPLSLTFFLQIPLHYSTLPLQYQVRHHSFLCEILQVPIDALEMSFPSSRGQDTGKGQAEWFYVGCPGSIQEREESEAQCLEDPWDVTQLWFPPLYRGFVSLAQSLVQMDPKTSSIVLQPCPSTALPMERKKQMKKILLVSLNHLP